MNSFAGVFGAYKQHERKTDDELRKLAPAGGRMELLASKSDKTGAFTPGF
jgi:hypothetical protein